MTLRTWDAPEEPSDIEGVRDRHDDLWRPGRDSGWFECGRGPEAWRGSVDRVGRSWASVLDFAPLREVTEAGERVGPIEITGAMIDAGVNAAVAQRNASTHHLVAFIIEAALRAGGYEVTE